MTQSQDRHWTPPPAPYPAVPYGAGSYPPPPVFPSPAPRWQATTLLILLVGYCMTSVGYAIHSFQLNRFLTDVENGVPVDDERADNLDMFGGAVGMLQLVLMLAAAVALICWMFVARSNAKAYAPGDFRRGHGWTIGSWFVPIVNLWFPYQCMKDITAASDPRRPAGYPAKTYSTAGSRLLGWWLLWLASVLVNRGAIGLYGDGVDADDMRMSFTMDYVVTGLELGAAVLLATAVLNVTAWQRDRYRAAMQWQAAQNPWGWQSR